MLTLDELLGFESRDPKDQHARQLVEADGRLLDELVAHARRQRLSQREIGQRMGITASAVSRIESGDRDPHLSTLRRYAFAVGVVIHHEVRSFQPESLLPRPSDESSAEQRAESWRATVPRLAQLAAGRR